VGTAVFQQPGSVRVTSQQAQSQQAQGTEASLLRDHGLLSTLDAFWFSFATVLPVPLGIKTRLQASSNYLWRVGSSDVGIRYTNVEVFLALAGWILIPIGVAGITGLLKR
jgi:hypothetical protein